MGRSVNFFRCLLTVILLWPGPAEAFKKSNGTLSVVLDKSYYFAGEPVYYKIFFHANETSISPIDNPILYAELWSHSGKLVGRQVQKLNKGQAHGKFDLDDNLKKGNYCIRAYLKEQLNQQQLHAVQIDLMILDENYITDDLSLSNKIDHSAAGKGNFSANRIELIPDRITYTARSKINITLKTNEHHTGDTLVLLAYARYPKYFPDPHVMNSREIKLNTNSSEFIPATNEDPSKIYLKGKYLLSGNEAKNNYKMIAYSMLGEIPFLGFEYTNSRGEFEIDITDAKGNDHIYLSAVNDDSGKIKIQEDEIPPFTCSNDQSTDQIDIEKLNNYVKNYTARRIIRENRQPANRMSAWDSISIYDTTRVYLRADKSYDMKEYVIFNDVHEMIREILPYVKITRRKEGHQLYIFNRKNPELKNKSDFIELEPDPLFLINGIPTRDQDFVLNMDFRSIDKVEILYSKPALLPFDWLGRSGILAIYTHQPVEVPNYRRVRIQGIMTSPALKSYNYGPGSVNERFPNFDPVPYWNPLLEITDKDKGFSFYCGDETGNLEILVAGFDEKGNIIQGKTSVMVRPLID